MTDRAYQTMSFIALMDTLYTDDDRITNNMRLSDKVLLQIYIITKVLTDFVKKRAKFYPFRSSFNSSCLITEKSTWQYPPGLLIK